MEITIGGMLFPTKGAAKAYVKALLRSEGTGPILAEPNKTLMIEVFKRHHEYSFEEGGGVSHIEIAPCPISRGNNNRFIAVRNDGSFTNFSYKKCFNKPSPRGVAFAAMRSAVWPQILKFRRLNMPEGLSACDVEVDHTDGITFVTLADQWLVLSNLTVADIKVNSGDGNTLGKWMVDPEQKTSWESYHAEHAKLRVLETAIHREVHRVGCRST